MRVSVHYGDDLPITVVLEGNNGCVCLRKEEWFPEFIRVNHLRLCREYGQEVAKIIGADYEERQRV